MTALLLVGGFTVIIGVYKGLRKSGANSYQEKVNSLKLADLDLEVDRLKLLIEIDEIDIIEE